VAEVDGAGKWMQALMVTLLALTPTILIVSILNPGKILNIFESAFVLNNPNVLIMGDILTNCAYRVGIQQGNYGLGTAIDLFKSFIDLIPLFLAMLVPLAKVLSDSFDRSSVYGLNFWPRNFDRGLQKQLSQSQPPAAPAGTDRFTPIASGCRGSGRLIRGRAGTSSSRAPTACASPPAPAGRWARGSPLPSQPLHTDISRARVRR
jgi:hypothetical protein